MNTMPMSVVRIVRVRLRAVAMSFMMFASCSAGAMAQQTPPEVLAEWNEEAQVSAYVRKVFQDREGNLWFGTNGDGACVWDGTSLSYPFVEQGYKGYAIRGILQDDDGAMWFATNGGVMRYASDEFRSYTKADGLSANEVWSLFRDRTGTIWAGTEAGVCR
ncbi:MAG: hypothetical protein KC983_06215, partial [Phycisphaerales bacterium]|nr:hypothetical protein [Phycisphaerales bacterium]